MTTGEEIALMDNHISQQVRLAGLKEWFCHDCNAGGIEDNTPDICPECGSERTQEIPR